jgi:hypothetical protein
MPAAAPGSGSVASISTVGGFATGSVLSRV